MPSLQILKTGALVQKTIFVWLFALYIHAIIYNSVYAWHSSVSRFIRPHYERA